jgi:cytochrome c oxidase assembly protein subunit 15
VTSQTVDPSIDGRASRLARIIFGANLVAQMGIVVTGAIVRVTSSGLGCPTWPRCTAGSFVPVDGQPEQWHKYVEFGNRSLTFILGVLAIASLIVGFLDRRRRKQAGLPARPRIFLLALVPILGTVAQAVLGGITVLTGLNPFVVASHFLLSLVLIALLTNLVVAASENADKPITLRVHPYIRTATFLLTGLMATVLVLGTLVTASGPHAGDAHVARTGWDPQLVSWIHADLVLLSVGLITGLIVALRATGAPRDTIAAAALALGLFLSQGLIGYVQYFTGLPWLVVVFHVLGSVIVWWSTVRLLLKTRVRGEG